MATISSLKFKTNPIPEIPNKKNIDLNILEYLLVCPINDILSDDNLVKLVLSSSYYSDAILEGSNLSSLDIIYNDKTYSIKRYSNISVLSLFDVTNKNRSIPINVNIIDSSLWYEGIHII